MPILLTPPVTLSHPHLFVATLRKDAKPTDKPQFSTVSLFTHDATATPQYKALVDAVNACAVEKWGADAFRQMVNEGTFESPFRRQIESKGYDPAVFSRFISSASNEDHPPTVLGADRNPIMDKREIYPGCVAIVSVSPRAYGGPGTGWAPGVKLDLRNVMKVGDGQRLASGDTGGSEFGPPAGGTAQPPTAADMAAALA